MLSMGLSLTVSQIIQPLRSTRLVIMALAANLVVVPAAAFALSRIIPLEEDVQIGLLLLGTAAGAPSFQARSDRQGERGVRRGANDDADGRDDSLLANRAAAPAARGRGRRRTDRGVADRADAHPADHRAAH